MIFKRFATDNLLATAGWAKSFGGGFTSFKFGHNVAGNRTQSSTIPWLTLLLEFSDELRQLHAFLLISLGKTLPQICALPQTLVLAVAQNEMVQYRNLQVLGPLE